VDRRPVERDDLADDADRLQVSRGVDRALVVEVGRQLVDEAAEEAADADQEVDVVRARVGDRLPVLPRLEQRQLVGVFGEDVGGPEEERGTLGRRTPAPVGLERAVGASTAAFTSAVPPSWARVMTSPVAGSSTGNRSASSWDDHR